MRSGTHWRYLGITPSLSAPAAVRRIATAAHSAHVGRRQLACDQLRLGQLSLLRTRHISIRGLRLSESLQDRSLELAHVSTKDIPADHLTKAVSGQNLPGAMKKLGLVEL